MSSVYAASPELETQEWEGSPEWELEDETELGGTAEWELEEEAELEGEWELEDETELEASPEWELEEEAELEGEWELEDETQLEGEWELEEELEGSSEWEWESHPAARAVLRPLVATAMPAIARAVMPAVRQLLPAARHAVGQVVKGMLHPGQTAALAHRAAALPGHLQSTALRGYGSHPGGVRHGALPRPMAGHPGWRHPGWRTYPGWRPMGQPAGAYRTWRGWGWPAPGTAPIGAPGRPVPPYWRWRTWGRPVPPQAPGGTWGQPAAPSRLPGRRYRRRPYPYWAAGYRTIGRPGSGRATALLLLEQLRGIITRGEAEAEATESSLFSPEHESESGAPEAHDARLTEVLAAEAAHTASESEAEALLGAALPVTIRIMAGPRSLRRVTPALVQANSRLVRSIRRSGPAGPQLLRTVPTIQRRTVASLRAMQGSGRPVAPRMVAPVMAGHAARVLGTPHICGPAIVRNTVVRRGSVRTGGPRPRRTPY